MPFKQAIPKRLWVRITMVELSERAVRDGLCRQEDLDCGVDPLHCGAGGLLRSGRL